MSEEKLKLKELAKICAKKKKLTARQPTFVSTSLMNFNLSLVAYKQVERFINNPEIHREISMLLNSGK